MEQLTPEAVEALAKSLVTKLEVAIRDTEVLEGVHKTLADQMAKFHQEDAQFKVNIEKELKALRTERYTLPSVALAVSAISLAVSLYLAVSTSAYQARTSEDIESLARIVRAQHGTP